jgi:CheY-like chemotaxis protein
MDHNNKPLVFIVDDDPDDRQIILDAFLENNPDVDYVFVENGKELMEILYSSRQDEFPTLILLDLNMPGMLGLQVLKAIKGNSRFSGIPTVILTTSILPNDRKLSYDLGANCFFTKPSKFDELVEITQYLSQMWLQKAVS